jgi:hypothetical protein
MHELVLYCREVIHERNYIAYISYQFMTRQQNATQNQNIKMSKVYPLKM